MHFKSTICVALALSAAFAGCSGTGPYQAESAAWGTDIQEQEASSTSMSPEVGADNVLFYSNVDRYKEALARHIVRHNSEHTFAGPLPPMLPAIVVLRMSVDKSGRLSDLFVHRSIDDVASQVALASVERSQLLPLPRNLLTSDEETLTFSETFLFNEDYRFQVRSLAQPQAPVE